MADMDSPWLAYPPLQVNLKSQYYFQVLMYEWNDAGKWFLLGWGLHWTNGFPVKPLAQLHIGVWLIVLHSVFLPHDPGQGSWHFWLMQACWTGHSELLTHSGLQFGGIPINSDRQEQEGVLLITWHTAFGPQGDGWQGFTGTFGTLPKIKGTLSRWD